ncbi:MAG TPA: glutamate formimidoyltransferase [Actinomycetes bacterium]
MTARPVDPERLVESVPNFSDGQRPAVVDEVVAAFAGAHPEVLVLDRSSDPDHDRTVLTLAGPGEALVAAAVAGAAACARLIDLRRQHGAHPRMGALDVLPFVPLGRVGVAECVALAEEAGRRLVAEAGIPVYFYGAAARRPERAALPAVRGGGFEALREAAPTDPASAPDLGGPALHPTAGATAVGVRPFLVAYNVELASDDLGLARSIAALVRERDGGLPAVRALGIPLPRRRRVQVSMNLLDFRVTPPAAAFAAVAAAAARAGVGVAGSEVVGLVPEAALAGVDAADLLLHGFSPDQFLERRLTQALAARAASSAAGDGSALAEAGRDPAGSGADLQGGAR